MHARPSFPQVAAGEARAADLDARLATTEELRKEMAEKEATLRAQYAEIGAMLGASQVQRQTGMVHLRLQQVLAERTSGSQTLMELQRSAELRELEKCVLPVCRPA